MTCQTAAILARHISAPEARVVAAILTRDNGEYTEADVRLIVHEYYVVCAAAGLDPVMVIAQMCHETNFLNAALAQRRDRDGNNLRNPAGIGVTGETSKWPRAGFAWDSDRLTYRACVGFARWEDSVRAHAGRLLAYALPPMPVTGVQAMLIDQALAARPLPMTYRGIAWTWRDLGTRWAPSEAYGEKIAAIAQAIIN